MSDDIIQVLVDSFLQSTKFVFKNIMALKHKELTKSNVSFHYDQSVPYKETWGKKMVLVQQPALAVVLILDLWSLCALSVLKK